MGVITQIPTPLKTMKESLAGNNAVARVNEILDELADTAHDVENHLQSALSDVGQGIQAFSPVDFSGIANLQGISVSASPFLGSLDVSMPDEDFYESADLENVALEGVDVLPFTANAPDLFFETKPPLNAPDDPGNAPALNPVEVPDAPDLDDLIKRIDDIMDTEPPVLPDAPAVELLTFDAVLKFDEDLEPPVNNFNYSETPYSSKLSDALVSRLTATILNGGVGLGSIAEDALWQRAKDRLNDEYEAEIQRTDARLAASGWSLPTGAHVGALTDITNKKNRALEQADFEILIEQARIAQGDYHKALDAGTAVERLLRDFHHAVHDRALKAAVASTEVAVNIYNALQEFNRLRLEKYKTEAAVFEARLRAQQTQLEVYKAQLEAMKTLTEVDIMRLNAIKAAIEAYEFAASFPLERAKLVVEIDRLRTEAFRQQVAVYTAKWTGEETKIRAWAQGIEGEKARVEAYRAEADAYAGYVAGVEAHARVKIAQAETKIKSNEAKIRKLEADANVFRTRVEARAEAARAKTGVFSAKVDAYRAYEGAKVAVAQAQAQSNEAQARHELNEAMVALDVQKANLEALLKQMGLKEEAFRTQASLYSQWMASLYAAMNISASMSDSESTGESISWQYGHQDSVGANVNENYSND